MPFGQLPDKAGIALLAGPPFVSEVTDGQIVDYFRSITPLSARGIVIYNAPGIGITLSPQIIERLADTPGA